MAKNLDAGQPYTDEKGNIIEGHAKGKLEIRFGASNCRIVFGSGAFISGQILMDCDGGELRIGPDTIYRGLIRVGLNSGVFIGNHLTVTRNCVITAQEGARVEIGDDCMFAANVRIRTDDAHPIYDRATGKRVNRSQSIRIGNHVWLAYEAAVFRGASIGDGSVIGFRSLVNNEIPANVIAVGTPARVVRTNIAWERPLLSEAANGGYFPDREPYEPAEEGKTEHVE